VPVMRDDVRPLGVVYTPSSVAAPMVELALGPLVRGKSSAELLELRVCDPAIGEGVFLVEVIGVLARALVAADGCEIAEARDRIARSCVYGADVDRRAVDAARVATGASASALVHGDALAMSWPETFPEVFARGGFDVVVANPPYIRQEWLANKQVLQRFASYDGVADLYVYFIELAHQLLRPDGRYCLIVPNKWLTAAYGRPLRALLAGKTSVDGIADLSRAPLFAGADAFPCIVWGTSTAERTTPVRAVRADATTPVAHALARGGELVPRDRWRATPWHLESGSERSLLERIEGAHPPLSEHLAGRPSRGVVTGCNRAFVIDRATRDGLLEREPACAHLVRSFVKGRDIRPWRHADEDRFILLVDRGTSLDELPAVRTYLEAFRVQLEPRPASWTGEWRGRKPGSYAWHELQDPVGPLVRSRAPRLLYQDIQTAPACALDDRGDVVPDTTVWMLPTDDLFLLAVLNSPLYGWYAKRRFPPALNGAVRPKLAYLAALPVPRIDAAQRNEISVLVKRRLAGDDPSLDQRIAASVAATYELSAAERTLIAD
jgi:hypothetical protein